MTTSTLLQMKNIVKAFGANTVLVLRGVDFELQRGEVHALLGSKGAGKSTLMKILAGVYTPDRGEIRINGTPVRIRSTQEANALGIGMVFQEFSLVPTLTVAQNVFLTREPRTSIGWLNDAESVRRTQALFAEMGEQIDPTQVVAKLSTGYWQLTELAKALSQDTRLLIMDEPTASLTRTETERLFELIRRLKAKGISIVYISHRMEEIFEIADRITVMRDGLRVATEPVANVSIEQVIEYSAGQKVEQVLAWKDLHPTANAFHLYLVAHRLSWVEVARAADVPVVAVWSIDQGHAIFPQQAVRVRQGLYLLTGVGYTGPIATISGDGIVFSV